MKKLNKNKLPSSYQKLKDKIALLEKEKSDLRKDLKKIVIDKCWKTTAQWTYVFETEVAYEHMIWAGSPTIQIHEKTEKGI